MAKTATAEKKIHHATMNKAIANDVKLDEVKDGYRAVHTSGKKANAPTAKEALDKVLVLIQPREEEGENEEGEDTGKIIVKDKYKKLYLPNGGNCGDKLAKALTTFRASGTEAFIKVCRENKIAPATWEGKNKGLQWMALSNVLRHRVKRKEEVTVHGEIVKSL